MDAYKYLWIELYALSLYRVYRKLDTISNGVCIMYS